MANSPKEAALLVLKRAAQEPEPAIAAALVSIAIRHVEAIQELVRPRKPKAAKVDADG